LDCQYTAGRYRHHNSKTALMDKILILGGGISGLGAVELALSLGHEVRLSELSSLNEQSKSTLTSANVPFEENGHSTTYLDWAELVIKSPGIPPTADAIVYLESKGVEVIGEVEWASRHTAATLIAITGSNGKTTTTNLIYTILKDADVNVEMVGNVGQSFAQSLAKRESDVYVIEMSSFQLDDCRTFSPDISVLLNITPDHLNRYNYDINEYAKSKIGITKNQNKDDVFIYCIDDEVTASVLELVPNTVKKIGFSQEEIVEEGAYRQNDNIQFITNNKQMGMSVYDLALQGRHNVYNTMAAGIVANLMNLRKENIRQSMQDFQNLEHRMEGVGFIKGIQFINDSKATNVNSTWYALESMTKKVVWIAGGVNKGNDYSSLIPLIEDKVDALICLGTDNKHLIKAFEGKVPVIEQTTSMNDAVKMAYYLAGKEAVVLLSPACASFDLFKNYEDRGRKFKQAVREL